MEDISIKVDQAAIGEESRLYSVGNKAAAISDSSAGKYPNSNGILNHKELSDEELVRVYVKTRDASPHLLSLPIWSSEKFLFDKSLFFVRESGKGLCIT